MSKYEYEFESVEQLTGNAAIYFNVPLSLITNTELLSLRVALFVYLSVYRGLNNRLCFSVPLFLTWVGYKSDSHEGGINDKVIDTLNQLSDLGYVTFCNDRPLTRTACIEIEFNRGLVFQLSWSESFGILYWDEVLRIMSYRNANLHDKYLNCTTVLLVFAYLRQAIFRLPNKLKPEERTPEGIADRRKRCIEAYNGNYKNIGALLGLGERTVSHAVDVLVQLGLIVTAVPYHVKNEDGEFRTLDVIFTNAYKRDGIDLLTRGEAYAMDEIKRKEAYMRSYYPNYYLRKKQYPQLEIDGIKDKGEIET